MSERSELITQELEAQLKELFQKLEKRVIIKCVLDESQKESGEMRGMIGHMASLSDLISLEVIDKSEASLSDVEHLPLTMIWNDNGYTGNSFHGVPGGQEMNSFIISILMAGGAKKVESLAGIKGEHKIQVLVSLACHHCAKQVINCLQIGYASDNVDVAMYDARLYPDLVEKYKIERIPLTVIDDKINFMGVKEIEEIVDILNT